MSSEPKLLSVPEAADYMRRSANFVRRVLRYECPVVQRGRRGPLYFYKSDLDRWLAQNTRQPAT
jgi:hypothetical protein